FHPKKKGKASAAAGGVKSGLTLGTVSATTIPKAIEVLPGGTLTLHSDPSLAAQLAFHCVNAALPGGIEPIAPAIMSGTDFIFPVSGGAMAPDFSYGKVISAGGQKVAKNDGNNVALQDCSQPPAVGTTVTQSNFRIDFEVKALIVDAVLPQHEQGDDHRGDGDRRGAHGAGVEHRVPEQESDPRQGLRPGRPVR